MTAGRLRRLLCPAGYSVDLCQAMSVLNQIPE